MATTQVFEDVQKSKVNIFARGNIIKTQYGNAILVTKDGTEDDEFEGVSLVSNQMVDFGVHGRRWSTRNASLFRGTITLTEG